MVYWKRDAAFQRIHHCSNAIVLLCSFKGRQSSCMLRYRNRNRNDVSKIEQFLSTFFFCVKQKVDTHHLAYTFVRKQIRNRDSAPVRLFHGQSSPCTYITSKMESFLYVFLKKYNSNKKLIKMHSGNYRKGDEANSTRIYL